MLITFRSQGGIGEVAKEMGFGKDISSKFSRLDSRCRDAEDAEIQDTENNGRLSCRHN